MMMMMMMMPVLMTILTEILLEEVKHLEKLLQNCCQKMHFPTTPPENSGQKRPAHHLYYWMNAFQTPHRFGTGDAEQFVYDQGRAPD
jgi:hypothetical protein